jgi:hypothetical protein
MLEVKQKVLVPARGKEQEKELEYLTTRLQSVELVSKLLRACPLAFAGI